MLKNWLIRKSRGERILDIRPFAPGIAFLSVGYTDGYYKPQLPDTEGNYRTPDLPKFVLHVPTLWQDELPSPGEAAEAVQSMLNSGA
jgi:hypothetical protein